MQTSLFTKRLELRLGTRTLLQAELDGRQALARALAAEVPDTWPPDLYDDDAIKYMLGTLDNNGGPGRWGFYYVLLPAMGGDRSLPLAIGAGGYKGPPDESGTVEIGYSILSDHQRRGYATEALHGWVEAAWTDARVRHIVSQTLVGHAASIGVMENAGFRYAGVGHDADAPPGIEIVRYCAGSKPTWIEDTRSGGRITDMSDKKIIAVIGATGSQGGGLVRAILADPGGDFAVRAITRDASSESAKALAAQGAEVVAADVDNEASLAAAFKGAHGVYAVTFYWAHFSPEKEKAHARNIAQAAKAAGVAHVIWSTLEDTRRWVPLTDDRMPTLMGDYKVPHFDAKGESNHFFTEIGVPTTFLYTSFYWDNLIHFGMGPKKDADGLLVFMLPMGDVPLSGIAADDIGKCAYGIFKKGDTYIGKSVGIAGEHLTGQQMADALSTALGQPVRYNAITAAAYRALGFPGADDLGNMFQFYSEFSKDFAAARSLETSRALNPTLRTFAGWLAENKDRIPLE